MKLPSAICLLWWSRAPCPLPSHNLNLKKRSPANRVRFNCKRRPRLGSEYRRAIQISRSGIQYETSNGLKWPRLAPLPFKFFGSFQSRKTQPVTSSSTKRCQRQDSRAFGTLRLKETNPLIVRCQYKRFLYFHVSCPMCVTSIFVACTFLNKRKLWDQVCWTFFQIVSSNLSAQFFYGFYTFEGFIYGSPIVMCSHLWNFYGNNEQTNGSNNFTLLH